MAQHWKKFFLVLAFYSGAAFAQDANIYKNLLVDEQTEAEVKAERQSNQEAVAAAQNQAKQMLQTRPQILRQKSFPKLRTTTGKIAALTNNNNRIAPFGLLWGASISETRNQGILLQAVDEKDYVNSFSATHLPKGITDFRQVNITFGEDDKLWRIIAYGNLLDDTPDAAKVMRLYRIYNDLLTKKYGHAEQFFTPAQIEVPSQDAKGRAITVTENAPLGNPQFLQQLQSGQAVLYSTYYNDEVGAALSVNVDGDGKSYIVLDYKNLQLLRAQENKTLDAL